VVGEEVDAKWILRWPKVVFLPQTTDALWDMLNDEALMLYIVCWHLQQLPNQLRIIIFVVAVTVFPLLKNNPVTMTVISLPACYFTISTD